MSPDSSYSCGERNFLWTNPRNWSGLLARRCPFVPLCRVERKTALLWIGLGDRDVQEILAIRKIDLLVPIEAR
jgi:hypothetical protein